MTFTAFYQNAPVLPNLVAVTCFSVFSCSYHASAGCVAGSPSLDAFFSARPRSTSVCGISTPPMSRMTCIIGGRVRAMLCSQFDVALVPF